MRRRYSMERLPGMEATTIRQCDVRRIVADHMLGFAIRQKYRELTRKMKREAKKHRVQSPQVTRQPKGINDVKCPIVFRTEFSGPRQGLINKMGLHVPGKIAVEVYHSKVGPPAEWRVRRPGTRIEFPITPQSQPETVKRQMSIYFATQASEWEAFDTTMPKGLQKLRSQDWATDNQGKPYLTKKYLEERTARLDSFNRRTVGQAVRDISEGR